MKIFLDMDGVLSDLVRQAVDLFRIKEGARSLVDRWRREHPGDYAIVPRIEEAMLSEDDFTENDFWDHIHNVGGLEFWRDMPKYSWAMDLWKGCRAIAGDDVFISSSPARSSHSVAGKAAWLRTQFSLGPNRYMLGSRKDLLAAPDCVLIDDADKNVGAFRDAGGHAILFPQPWNANHERIGVQLTWTMAELGRIGAEIAASKK